VKERLVTCNEEDTDGRARVTRDEERVLTGYTSCSSNLMSIMTIALLSLKPEFRALARFFFYRREVTKLRPKV